MKALKKDQPKAYSYLRFSTTEQLKGDSQRRQLALAREYADRHGLDLDETLTFRDLGVSAWKGKNIKEGALGVFLEAVDSGHVPPGSYLLVENLDRLSRDKVMPALMQFQAILERGVNVVTLQDGHEYTRSTLNDNPTALVLSIMSMFRANEESEIKSKRLLAVWENKRAKAQADGTKLTARCPAWLRLDKSSGKFKVIDKRASVVHQIFKLALSGIGKGVIAKRLNADGVPTFSGRGNGWSPSAIQNILESEAVVGTYQPRKSRRHDDPPIPDYFPAIVKQTTFLKVRELRRSRLNGDRPSGGGRKGETFSNLFTGLAQCGICGSPMHHVKKGHGQVYLICSDAKWGNGCKYVSWQYGPAEYFILNGLQIVEFSTLFPTFSDTATEAIKGLEDELLIVWNALDTNSTAIDNVVEVLTARPDSAPMLKKLDALAVETGALEQRLKDTEARLDAARRTLRNAKADHATTQAELSDWLAGGDGGGDADVVYERRSRLHQLLRQTIECIRFTSPPPLGAHHGDITVHFHGEPEYAPIIRVDNGQRKAVSDGGVLTMTYPPTPD